MAKTICKIPVECNSVRKHVGNDQVQFNIKSKGNSPSGNVSLTNQKNDGSSAISGDFEPGQEYEVIIKEKS